MSKKIVYVGLERCDFIYHLTSILSLKGSVLAIDNSRRQDLFISVCKDSDKTYKEWRNITYAKNIDIDNSNLDEYDYVVIYAGMDIEDSYFTNAFTLMMPDYTDMSLQLMENVPVSPKDAVYIMRDYCSNKINDKGIAQRLNISVKNIAGHIALTGNDMAAYIALTHNTHQNIKALSNDMITALTYATATIFDTDEKQALKLIDQAKKLK